MSLRRVPALNPERWQKTLQQTLERFSEFDGTKLLLDEPNSYDDVLRFDVLDFSGAISSDVTNELQKKFGNMVTLTHEFNPQSSRQKLVAIKVTRPEDAVLDYVVKLHDNYRAFLSKRNCNLPTLAVLFFIACGFVAHASYLLHEHTALKVDAFSLLLHFTTHKLATLFVSISQ